MDALTRNWLLLLALTAVTVVLASINGVYAMAGLGVLVWAKARAILAGFLHLKPATGWLSVVMVPLGLWLIVLWGLYALSLR